MNAQVEETIDRIYRESWAQILATLVRHTRDMDIAEDALQDALARAISTWPAEGIPPNPAGWVNTTARRIAIDHYRRLRRLQSKLPQLVIPDGNDPELHTIDLSFGDDRLRLIFTCCHPLLTPESRVALTLRMICGVSTPDIASLFLVQETTMAARISRAKKKLSSSGVAYRIPSPEDINDRLNDVLSVVYLVATTGHTSGSGEGLHNASHMQLALDLTRVLHELIPRHPEVLALRALVLLAEARKASRLDAAGDALPLEQMDRSLWDSDLIAKAQHLTEESLRISDPDSVGAYTLQAAIAMVHAEAASYEETDWEQIVALYTLLDTRHPSAVVRLGYAIAIGMRDQPQAGLDVIYRSNLNEALAGYPMLAAAQADLHRRLGNVEMAANYYREAAYLTDNAILARWFLKQTEG